MKLVCSTSDPPLGGLFVAEHLRLFDGAPVEVSWGSETLVDGRRCSGSADVARLIAPELCGSGALETTQVDHWMTWGALRAGRRIEGALGAVDAALAPSTYLVGGRITVADYVVFAALYASERFQSKLDVAPVNLLRWYRYLSTRDVVVRVLEALPGEVKTALRRPVRLRRSSNRSSLEKPPQKARAQEGKFVELPGAETGKVVVRFPPEASGYLHIGHAKAALLNQYYQEAFQGQLIMRFDDTNPAKENAHFEKVILEDVAMLRIKPDRFTHTSQYFDLMIEYCERLIGDKMAYVDDTDAETMKAEREQRIESKNRNKSVEENFRLWKEMKAGTMEGQRCCVRAKIDMQSMNGCMRDPTIYRCKNEVHPRTGDRYKVYPTYDFACPIVDAVEGVTHTLRTMEYHDRDPQFYWFIEALGLRRPHIWEYSRLSMTNTVLSKRKLTWFVENGLVDGWDDPRMPTVRGVLRRGMTVEGLKEFIVAQGSSRSVVFMEWDKIWAFNKKVIDPVAPRYTALEASEPVRVRVSGVQNQVLTVPKHPKNPDVGTKRVSIGPQVLIDRADAESLKPGSNATFINWGNLLVKTVERDGDGRIVGVTAESNVDDKDYKKTPKVTWLADEGSLTPTYCVYFDHLISKPLLGKDEDFKQYVKHQTRREVAMLGDPELASLRAGDIIQLQRRGFFRADVAYEARGPHTGKERPLVLFSVPDGHVNENPLGLPPADGNGTKVVSGSQMKENVKNAPGTQQEAQGQLSAEELSQEITKQGDLVRNLKAEKATKDKIQDSVKVLLDLKNQFKTLTGTEWKPVPVGVKPVPVEVNQEPTSVSELNQEISKQGDLVRSLKAEKAPKDKIQDSVKILLDLKNRFKTLTGSDWKPVPVEVKQEPTSANDLDQEISKQGDLVRNLKAEKAPKDKIQDSVKVLLHLKNRFKTLTGSDWKPVPVEVKQEPTSVSELNQEITKQGDLVRSLKAEKAPKDKIQDSVKILLDLKNRFKTLTGTDWKPVPVEVKQEPTSVSELNQEISKQGDLVRNLKAEKAPKDKIQDSVKILLDLKNQFKTLTGTEWKPVPVEVKPVPVEVKQEPTSVSELNQEILKQGDLVRSLKAEKAPKDKIQDSVKILLDLKNQFKTLTGTDWKPVEVKQQTVPTVSGQGDKRSITGTESQSQAKAPSKQKESKSKPVTKSSVAETGPKKQTRLGLEARKEESLSDWYSQVITKGEMIEYYDVSGCYILRPWSFAIWETIRDWFDGEIKRLGVQNCYFPIFVSANVLEREKDHIADFAPEVAWVTRSGDSELAEPIAVRPTSETVMYPAYAKWIQSYRDLPIKLNQWNNVVRWEFKHPQPFLRTREFLWQEGHTAYADQSEAQLEVETIIDLYAKVYTDLLAVPVVRGRKTEKEKFAGGDYTLTVEAFVSASGRGIQGATSHHLAQNFSKMFDVSYEDPDTKEKRHVYQNSWGITTRTIGVMIMVHSDNRGLVLPPEVASVQVVVVPCGITVGLPEEKQVELLEQCVTLEKELEGAAIRVRGDHRMNYSPGWKFNHWELKGVPIRVELGPKDIEKNQIVAVRRDTSEKIVLSRRQAASELKRLLVEIQNALYKRACDDLTSHIVRLSDWSKFTPTLDRKNLILAPFCGDSACEDRIKAESTRDEEGAEPGAPSMGAKSLCIPSQQPAEIGPGDKCIHPACNKNPLFHTLFGRSY